LKDIGLDWQTEVERMRDEQELLRKLEAEVAEESAKVAEAVKRVKIATDLDPNVTDILSPKGRQILPVTEMVISRPICYPVPWAGLYLYTSYDGHGPAISGRDPDKWCRIVYGEPDRNGDQWPRVALGDEILPLQVYSCSRDPSARLTHVFAAGPVDLELKGVAQSQFTFGRCHWCWRWFSLAGMEDETCPSCGARLGKEHPRKTLTGGEHLDRIWMKPDITFAGFNPDASPDGVTFNALAPQPFGFQPAYPGAWFYSRGYGFHVSMMALPRHAMREPGNHDTEVKKLLAN